VIFIQHGKIVLDAEMETLGERFLQLIPSAGNIERARAIGPFYEREVFGRVAMLFEGKEARTLEALGEARAPSVADLFVAMMQPAGKPVAAKEAA
jgi:ABC-2 type transport system ATP-binding protein